MKLSLRWLPLFVVASAAACASEADAPSPAVDASVPPADAAIEATLGNDGGAVDAAVDAEAQWYPGDCTPDILCAVDIGIDPTSKLGGITCDATNIWAVGARGLVLHHDGTTWTQTKLSPPNPQSNAVDSLAQVSLRPGAKVWTLGNISTVYVGPGAGDAGPSGFAPLPLPYQYDYNFISLALWGHNDTPDSAWLVGDYLYRLDLTPDGANLNPYLPLQPDAPFSGVTFEINAVHGATKDDLWIVGRAGASYHVANVFADAPFIERLDSQTFQPLNAVWSFSSTDIWAVGGAGTIRHYTGAGHRWEIIDSPVSGTLTAMWASSASDIWAVGEQGLAIHYDGKAWARVPVGKLGGRKPDIKSVWGSGSGRVFAVADNFVITLGATASTVTK